jgi:hypothetical protein
MIRSVEHNKRQITRIKTNIYTQTTLLGRLLLEVISHQISYQSQFQWLRLRFWIRTKDLAKIGSRKLTSKPSISLINLIQAIYLPSSLILACKSQIMPLPALNHRIIDLREAPKLSGSNRLRSESTLLLQTALAGCNRQMLKPISESAFNRRPWWTGLQTLKHWWMWGIAWLQIEYNNLF